MKKFLSLILCILLVSAFLPLAFAAETFKAPEIRFTGSKTENGDITYDFDFSAEDGAYYEENRQLIYRRISELFTDEEIALTDNEWVLYPLVLLIEAQRDGDITPVKTETLDGENIRLSLTRDVLPALVKGGRYTHDSFSFLLRFSLALDTGDGFIIVSAVTPSGPYTCPETGHIEFLAPEGTVNPNPAFPFLPYEDIRLQNPTHEGYVFSGWKNGENFIDTVPGNTLDLTVDSLWRPRVFKISYVLTTRTGSFVFVNNLDNPRERTYGEKTELLALTPPVGYVFAGWYDNAEFKGLPLTRIPEALVGDVILWARWLTIEEDTNEKIQKAHWGDLDSDGAVTSADARLALRNAVGLEELDARILIRADFGRKSFLTAEDARQILRICVGLDQLSDVLRAYELI